MNYIYPGQVWRYSDIKKIWYKGRRGVLLPNGRVISKGLNRKRGLIQWMILGRVNIGGKT